MQNNKPEKGRPAGLIEPIKATSERVAQSIMKAPPKKEWSYITAKTKAK